jgi:hypothetical protein
VKNGTFILMMLENHARNLNFGKSAYDDPIGTRCQEEIKIADGTLLRGRRGIT